MARDTPNVVSQFDWSIYIVDKQGLGGLGSCESVVRGLWAVGWCKVSAFSILLSEKKSEISFDATLLSALILAGSYLRVEYPL